MAGASALRDHRAHATHLEGAADLVERVAVVAHDLAGLAGVVQFLGKLQQGKLAFGTLGDSGHRWSPGSLRFGDANLPGAAGGRSPRGVIG
jgi:hypothetical protein